MVGLLGDQEWVGALGDISLVELSWLVRALSVDVTNDDEGREAACVGTISTQVGSVLSVARRSVQLNNVQSGTACSSSTVGVVHLRLNDQAVSVSSHKDVVDASSSEFTVVVIVATFDVNDVCRLVKEAFEGLVQTDPLPSTELRQQHLRYE